MRGRGPDQNPGGSTGIRWLGRAYQGGLEAVLALVIMTVLGAWADSRFDTAPVLFLIGLAIGFGSFTLRLVRLLRQLEQRPRGEGPKHEGGK